MFEKRRDRYYNKDTIQRHFTATTRTADSSTVVLVLYLNIYYI